MSNTGAYDPAQHAAAGVDASAPNSGQVVAGGAAGDQQPARVPRRNTRWDSPPVSAPNAANPAPLGPGPVANQNAPPAQQATNPNNPEVIHVQASVQQQAPPQQQYHYRYDPASQQVVSSQPQPDLSYSNPQVLGTSSSLSPHAMPFVPPQNGQFPPYVPSIQGPLENPGVRASHGYSSQQGGWSQPGVAYQPGVFQHQAGWSQPQAGYVPQSNAYDAMSSSYTGRNHRSNIPVLQGPSMPAVSVQQPVPTFSWGTTPNVYQPGYRGPVTDPNVQPLQGQHTPAAGFSGPDPQVYAHQRVNQAPVPYPASSSAPPQVPAQGYPPYSSSTGGQPHFQAQGYQPHVYEPRQPSSYDGRPAVSAGSEHIILGGEKVSRKSARTSMDRVYKSFKVLPGDETVYVGPSTSVNHKLTYHNDAVFFVDALSKYLDVADGSIWGFPMDQLCTDQRTRPIPDAGTPFRVELFSRLIPHSSATRSSMVPQTLVTTYLINGSRCKVPYEQVTITDWSRILVAEAAKSQTARDAAQVAMNNIELEKGEAWLSAAARMLLHVRTKHANPDRPFTSEARYFWRFAAAQTVNEAMERTLRLFLPEQTDFGSMESLLVGSVREVKDLCESLQVDYSDPASPEMLRRGSELQQIYNTFVNDLSNRSSSFYSGYDKPKTTSFGSRRNSVSVGALSNRKPLGNCSEDRIRPSRGQPKFNRNHLLGALAECLGSTAEYEPQVAAFDNRAASKPGATGTPFQNKPQKRVRRSSGSGSDASLESSSRAPKTRRTGSAAASPLSDEEELPEPNDSPEVIFKAVKRRKVCFFYATGVKCPHNGGGRRCLFKHDDPIITYGYYATQQPPTREEVANLAMLRAYGDDIEGESVSTSDTEVVHEEVEEDDQYSGDN